MHACIVAGSWDQPLNALQRRMWNISSLAQRAKDAAAQIEHQINDSIGGVQEEKMSNPDQQEETTDGYLNVEEECVSFSERDEDTTHCDIDKQPK